MKLSFLPADLHATCDQTGFFVVTLSGGEILRTRSQKAAVSKFNEIRKEMEKRFPVHELSDEEKAKNRRRMLVDALVQHNSLGGRRKKTTAGSTRTFGG
jgi:hypothetical protein